MWQVHKPSLQAVFSKSLASDVEVIALLRGLCSIHGQFTNTSHRSGHESHRNQVQHPSELVAIVDENNQPVGSCTRGQMRAENLIHRSSFVAIFNSQVWQLCTASDDLGKKHANYMFGHQRTLHICSGTNLRAKASVLQGDLSVLL